MERKPTFVSRSGITSDKDYLAWLSEIKMRFQRSQVKAAVRVNSAMLEFYWSLGRDIVNQRAENKYGSGFFDQLSLDMRQMFPYETGFSATNLKYIKRWYAFYNERVTVKQQLCGKSDAKNRQQLVDEFEGEPNVNRQQLVDDLAMPELFGQIPWGHHILIISKCQTLEEALFYLHQVAEGGWSRSWLEDQIQARLHSRQGSAVTNFSATLPEAQKELATEILKDPYNFEFLSMKARYDEKDLEEALVANITNFLLELGKGFSYVGRQMELQMPGGQTFFPDLVFYHIPQHRYVIIELKAVKYTPEFAGKLNFYVTAADKLLRGEGDNPSVGLIICKSTDKTVVEWSLQDIQKPLGVATYQLQEVVERTVLELKQKNEKEDNV